MVDAEGYNPFREPGDPFEGIRRRIEAENKHGIEIRPEWKPGQEVPEFINLLNNGSKPDSIVFYSAQTGMMRFFDEGNLPGYEKSFSYGNKKNFITIGIKNDLAVIPGPRNFFIDFNPPPSSPVS